MSMRPVIPNPVAPLMYASAYFVLRTASWRNPYAIRTTQYRLSNHNKATGFSIIQILALVLVGCLLPATPGQAQTACDDTLLDEADRLYDLGRFDETVELLNPCLPEPASNFRRRAQATQALRLMALSYYARREPPDSTRQWVRRLVRLDRGYRADPEEDPLFFQYLVDALRPPRWYQRRWVQIGGGLVVGAAVGCLVTRCLSKTIDPLPGPPSDPPRGAQY